MSSPACPMPVRSTFRAPPRSAPWADCGRSAAAPRNGSRPPRPPRWSPSFPDISGDVRLTRNELDDAIRQPLTDFAGVLQDTLDRTGGRSGDLVAVASAGGGARIPLITTTLSEHFRVPVITTPQPELTAAIGGGLKAARGTADEGATAMAVAPAVGCRSRGRHPDGAGSRVRRGRVEHLPGSGLVRGRRHSRRRPHRSV